MSVPNTVHVLTPAAYVQIPVASMLTGYSEKAIRRKIEEGNWLEGDQYRHEPNGTISISMEGYARWCEGKVATPATRDKKLPPEGRTSLYRHFDADGQLLYVGISLSVTARLGAHMVGSHWADAIARVEVERFPTRAEALKAERAAIIAEKPVHNIVHASRQ